MKTVHILQNEELDKISDSIGVIQLSASRGLNELKKENTLEEKREILEEVLNQIINHTRNIAEKLK